MKDLINIVDLLCSERLIYKNPIVSSIKWDNFFKNVPCKVNSTQRNENTWILCFKYWCWFRTPTAGLKGFSRAPTSFFDQNIDTRHHIGIVGENLHL